MEYVTPLYCSEKWCQTRKDALNKGLQLLLVGESLNAARRILDELQRANPEAILIRRSGDLCFRDHSVIHAISAAAPPSAIEGRRIDQVICSPYALCAMSTGMCEELRIIMMRSSVPEEFQWIFLED